MGGAAFNVAWNLQGLGRNPLFVSALGQDNEADVIRQKMSRHGLDTRGLQTNEYSTGKVEVRFDDGEPSYRIVSQQAYDFLQPFPDDLASVDDIGIIYHGSLIWRSPDSRNAVQSLRAGIDAPVFVDLNIREPWFQMQQLGSLLTGIDALKLNHRELEVITGRSLPEKEMLCDSALALLSRYSIRAVWVTCGDLGAFYFDNAGTEAFVPAVRIAQVVDTVGAGDAFSAAVIDGFLSQRSAGSILTDAVRFAARVCGLQGATTVDPSFYQSFQPG